jgi:O-antigen/teichoic acid export membrane protein
MTTTPTGAKTPLFFWAGKGALAVADQGLIAGSNHVLSAALARWLPAAEYGAFAVAFTVLMLVANAYQALLLLPSLVLGPSTYAERLRAYVATLVKIHVVSSVPLAGLLAAIALATRETSPTLSQAALGLAVALPPVVLYWLARNSLYLSLRSGEAAFGATLYAAVQLGVLFGLHARGEVSLLVGFCAMAAGAMSLTLFLFWRLRPDFRGAEGAVTCADVMRRSWELGRFEVGVAFVLWVPQSMCFSVAASALGAQAAGALRALWNLAMPMNHALIAILRLAAPHWSARHGGSETGVPARSLLFLLFLCAVAAFAYIMPASLFATWILDALYAGNYTDRASWLPWVLAVGAFWAIAETVSVGLRVNRVPRRILVGYGIAALVYVLVAWPMATALGFAGVVLSMLLASALALGAVSVLFFGRRRGSG